MAQITPMGNEYFTDAENLSEATDMFEEELKTRMAGVGFKPEKMIYVVRDIAGNVAAASLFMRLSQQRIVCFGDPSWITMYGSDARQVVFERSLVHYMEHVRKLPFKKLAKFL